MSILIFAALLALPLAGQSETYYLAFLRRVPNLEALPKGEGERLQAEHMANIHAMAERGALVAAGPFGDQPSVIAGIFLFKAGSLAEARRLAEGDPTVAAHRNTVEAYTWRGPQGIGEEYVRLHKTDPKTPEDMGVHPLVLLFRGRPLADPRAHEDYIDRLRREGKVAAAGPIDGDPDLASVVIFKRIPDDEARRLIGEDPAVQSGALRPEFHRWWSAAHVLPD
jgi:uncharacterized protein YciI